MESSVNFFSPPLWKYDRPKNDLFEHFSKKNDKKIVAFSAHSPFTFSFGNKNAPSENFEVVKPKVGVVK